MGVTNLDSLTLGSNLIVGGDLTVTGTTISAGETVTDLTATGNTILGNAVTDTLAITGATSILSTSASALAVGRLGATTPVLKVNAATSTVVTGVEIIGAATGGNVQLNAIGGTNESLILAGKGTGSVNLGQATSTGVTLVADQPILDSSANEYFKFSKTASAINEFTVANAAIGGTPTISATGGDSNIVVQFSGKGTGAVILGQATSTSVGLAADQPIADSSANELIKFTKVASAVNEITIGNNSTGLGPTLTASGETNVPVTLAGKGTGYVGLGQSTTTDVRLVADQPIADSSGNEFIKFVKTASAINELTVTNGATAGTVDLKVTGSDTVVAAWTMSGKAAGAATVAGGSVAIAGGLGNTSGAGGAVSLTGGVGGDAGAGGAASLIAGAAGTGTANAVGGQANVTGGAGQGTSAGGAVVLTSGASENGTGVSPGASGAIQLTVGAAGTATTGVGGAGGTLTLLGAAGGLSTGASSVGGAGSDVVITAGAGGASSGGTDTGGAGGDIVLTPGASGSGATPGATGLIINRGGVVRSQPTQTAKTTSATLTVAELSPGIITVNQGAAGASALQLPTAATMDTAFPSMTTNDSIDISLINVSTVAAEDASITTNTGWTLVGNMDVASNAAATDKSAGLFRLRKTGAATWTIYRLS